MKHTVGVATSLKGEIVVNENGWRSIKLDALERILKKLPFGCSIGPNDLGHMTVVDSSGDYIGYIDMKREQLHLLDELV